jgi:hypothetical protein
MNIDWRLIDADTAHLNKSRTSPLLPGHVTPLFFRLADASAVLHFLCFTALFSQLGIQQC